MSEKQDIIIGELQDKNIELEERLEAIVDSDPRKSHKIQAALVLGMSRIERYLSNTNPRLYKDLQEFLERKETEATYK